MENKIGFVVWGIRNGFKNNWLSSNVDAAIYQSFTDDMRQICNSTVDKFYSIEKIENNTVLSVFNPNTKDHVQRKAYIALSIVIPNGYEILGDVIGCLSSMLQTYEVKQGNAMVNMVNVDDVKVHLAQLEIKPEANMFNSAGNGIGVFYYNSHNEIQIHFGNPSIFGFKKVFFISGQNVAIERMPNIQSVQSFAKPLFLTVSDFEPNRHSVTINNQPITMTRMSVKQGDNIRITESKTGQSKSFQISNRDEYISLKELFPPIMQYPELTSGNGNKNKIIGLVSLALLLIGGIVYFFRPPETPVVSEGVTVEEETRIQKFSAVYDFEKLELINCPLETNDSTLFYIYKLSNDSNIIDSIYKLNSISNSKKLALKKVSDTLLMVRFKVANEMKTLKINVDFKLPSEHKILSGEALSKIAERYGIKRETLMKWNNISNENSIREGQVILLKPKDLNISETEENEEVDQPSGTINKPMPKGNSNTSNSGNDEKTFNGGNSAGEPKPTPKTSSNQNEIEKLKKEIKSLIAKKTDPKVLADLNKRLNGCKDDLDKLKILKEDLY